MVAAYSEMQQCSLYQMIINTTPNLKLKIFGLREEVLYKRYIVPWSGRYWGRGRWKYAR